MTKLMIILGSVREGRIGGPIAEWVKAAADADDRYEVDFVDLAELDLPFMDEPNHPRLKNYVKDHTKAWSARVEAADGFLFVFPEYNYSYSPAIKNASALGMVMTKGNVEINFPQKQLTDDGVFEPNEQQSAVVKAQLDEIVKLSAALAPLRG